MGESRIAEIEQAVASRSDELVGLLTSFVRLPSENPPGSHLREAQAWIGDRLTEYGIPFQTYSTSRTDTDHAVMIGTVGTGERIVYLHGHYDVVPAFEPGVRHVREWVQLRPGSVWSVVLWAFLASLGYAVATIPGRVVHDALLVTAGHHGGDGARDAVAVLLPAFVGALSVGLGLEAPWGARRPTAPGEGDGAQWPPHAARSLTPSAPPGA